jgi:hypothetical protein
MTRAARLEDVLELRRRVAGVRLPAREAAAIGRRMKGVKWGDIVSVVEREGERSVRGGKRFRNEKVSGVGHV